MISRRSLLLATPALLLPSRSIARSPIHGAGGGGGGYHASAVHFDGSTWLRNGSLIATDTHVLSYAFFFNIVPFVGNHGIIFVVDPENNYTSLVQANPSTSGHPNTVFSALYDAFGNSAHSIQAYTSNAIIDNTWHSLVFSGQTDGSGSNPFKMFIDRIDVTSTLSDTGTPFQMVFNALSFWFGADGFGDTLIGDISNVWIASNVSLISGGTIPSANLDLFVNASLKPVNPSGWPSSTIQFVGDSTSFATNQGTGGAFTLTGTLTNATTSPSD